MRRFKLILLIIAGICALVLVTILILHAWLPGALSGKIENVIRTSLNPESTELYEVEVGTISFSTLFQATNISKIRVTPKDNVLNEIDSGLLPNQIFEMGVYNLDISSWTLISLARGRKSVDVDRFFADSILISMYANDSSVIKTDTAQSMNMDQLHFNNLRTNKLRIELRSLADTSKQVLQTGKIDFTGVINFYDKEQDHFLNPGIQAHSLEVWDIDGFSTDGLYAFHVERVLLNDKEQTADLHGLSMIPQYSKQEFYKHVPFETDRFEASLDQIKISGFQSDKATQDGSIIISQIELIGGKFEVFRDRKPPFNVQQRPPMPVRMIQDAPFGLFVGEIIFNDFDIVYSELPIGSDAAGEIPFKQISATILNLSNLKDSLASDSIMSIQGEALIFGKAKLQAEITYDLTDSNGTYEAKGGLATLSFVHINPAMYPITGIKINDGIHQHASFYFYGNDVRSVGELRMQYSGLVIELTPERRKFVKGLARFAGKTMVYHQDNPSDNDELRVGKIEFNRDISRFVFNYWWKCYLSGVKHTILRDSFSEI